MKRIIYILAIVIAIATVFGGITVFADATTDNSTRGGVYGEITDAENEDMSDEYAANVEGESGNVNKATAESESIADSNESTPEENEPFNGENVAGDNENVAGGNENVADDSKNVAGGNENVAGGNENVAGDNKNVAGSNESTNPFEVVWSTVKAYATEIFCALSFVGSLILAYAYKSGLLPIIKGGIGAISNTVSHIKDATQRAETKSDELSIVLCNRLSEAESCLDGIGKSLDGLEKRLDALSSDATERQRLRIILSAQIDMLYGIFMTSALPQYQKDEIGAKIAEMREALLANEDK